ncbi:two-component response regulator ARR [Salix suchowensis]|nr:two-component response regulator ARR [Salix suchowensis]
MCSLQSSITRSKVMAGGEENSDAGKTDFHVLVVDDSTVVRMVHRMLMTSLGWKVQEAKNGKEAVDLHINGAYFDLIFMDMEMPIMNGPTATRELRAMGVKSNIIGVTSSGLNHCVSKPLTIAMISSFLPDSNNK